MDDTPVVRASAEEVVRAAEPFRASFAPASLVG
jgi:hypothetical protein